MASRGADGDKLSESWVCVASRSESPKISIADQYLRELADSDSDLASSRVKRSPKSLPNAPSTGSGAEPSSRCETPDYPIIDQFLQMLRDAQRENNYSSCDSPKSPPNSPAVEMFVDYRGEAQSEYDSLCWSIPSARYANALQSPSLSPASGCEVERSKDTPPMINRTFKRYVRHRRRVCFLDREFLVSFIASNVVVFAIGTVIGLMFFHMR